ncbi:hypothetical protein ENHYD8BJ_130034 [Enhydrobacter sp. 8BJ]|nr:hypothetical protein ENHYD8BJ_130034 [Enhydrobacter sp. 8BJ]
MTHPTIKAKKIELSLSKVYSHPVNFRGANFCHWVFP